MNFEKKLVILSGKTGNGTALIESNGMGTFVTLNAFSLPDLTAGEYALGVKTASTIFRREVGSLGRIKSKFSLPDGDYSSVHLVVFRTYDEEVVLYGAAGNRKLWEANIMDGLRSERREKKTFNVSPAKTQEEKDFEYSKKKIEDYFFDIDATRYTDNAISPVNYFEYSRRENVSDYYDEPSSPSEMQKKYLNGRFGAKRADSAFKPLSSEPRVNTEPRAEREIKSERVLPPVEREQVAATVYKSEEPIKIKSASQYTAQQAVASVKTDACYYAAAKPKIDKLFETCDRFPPLENALPDTKWVKVNYDSGGRYYVVGLIGTAPDYIAYGVPGKYGASALEGADFVPLGEKPGDGFWILFQSAQTGKEVVKE